MREKIECLLFFACFKLLIYLLFNDRWDLSVSRSKATHTYGLDCDETAIPEESGLFGARRYSGSVSAVLRVQVSWVAVSL